ncbi:MAG: type IV toxin-antitoxin system AbiEi family antitoxin [Labilithrix sp.]
MARSPSAMLRARVPASLAGALDVPVGQVRERRGAGGVADLVVSAAGKTFAIELLGGAPAGRVAAHAERVARAARKLGASVVPVVAVPFMTDAGRKACQAAGVSWFDLSGNAHIVAPGLRVIVDGRPNQYRPRGRPSSVFAPKSARVVRWLLLRPQQAFTQREIARSTGMSDGFVSRIVTRLEADGFVDRVADGHGAGDVDGSGRGDGTRRGRAPVRVRDAAVLLDAWRDEYEFAKHTILRGHVAARSGDALTRLVGERLTARKVEHAATGLSAAWQLSRFAAFRIATFFVATEPSAALLKEIGFREEPRGANLWIVVPNDAGVFLGADDHDGVRCVHPVQAYLDLAEHPERAAEAAERLRSEFMRWKTRG